MNILIISRTPWNDDNSFGNTFSNLFGGMRDVTLYNICCQNGATNNKVVSETYQMDDMSVLKSIFKKNSGIKQESVRTSGRGDNFTVRISHHRFVLIFIIRDLIWKFGNWRKRRELIDFLKRSNPEIIYLPIYASWYMCDVDKYIIGKCDVPVVGHISDDVYSYPPLFSVSPLFQFYRFVLRRKLRYLFKCLSYGEVFALNMQLVYERIFHIPFYLIGKGVDTAQLKMIPKALNNQQNIIKFVYTGNIGGGRYKVLADLAHAIDDTFEIGEATLEIYSQTYIDSIIKREFSRCTSLRFMGSISRVEVTKVQQSANYLVHVEGFSKKSIFEAKMSFSTKLIDYLLLGRPIFAIGPSVVNSIEFLKRNKLSLVASSDCEIRDIICKIKEGKIDTHQMLVLSYEYLKSQRNITKIQSEIFLRMKSLLSNRDK
jgi:uncharacterized protein YbgA (DUF1722 family)